MKQIFQLIRQRAQQVINSTDCRKSQCDLQNESVIAKQGTEQSKCDQHDCQRIKKHQDRCGTGNNEIVLDRRMADSRKFPAINLKKSGTRRDDLLLSKDELARLWLLRNAVANMDDNDMSVFLIDKMRKTHNNKEFLSSMSTGAAAGPAFTASSSYK